MKNRLFYGDCLDVLQNSIDDDSIDLIYIDPPFNSKRNYNVLFESIDMTDTKAQKEAFADTWSNVKYIRSRRSKQSCFFHPLCASRFQCTANHPS